MYFTFILPYVTNKVSRSDKMGNKKTPLYTDHIAMGGKIVDFSGWDMPIHYGSQIEEHHQVRKHAGMFDVSHMTIIDMKGKDAKAFLANLLANDIGKLKTPGKALYSCMLNESGGIIDDLITYYINDNFYRTVVNAATHDKDISWINNVASNFDVEITERTDLAMIAVQGPQACEISSPLLPDEIRQQALALKPFNAILHNDFMVARTGYTGEDGYEIMLPNEQASQLWQALHKSGIKPSGLGARDTLRLEAGMNLYGTDMDESITPWECGLAWTVALTPDDRDFIGRKALVEKKNNCDVEFVGLVLETKGVIRNHQKVIIDDGKEGEVTSGSFSPTLQKAIAFARIPKTNATQCNIEMRGKLLPASIVKPMFVRNGKACVQTR